MELDKKINSLRIEIDNIKQLEHYLRLNLVFLEQVKREKITELLHYASTERIIKELEKSNK